ncbi:hypothetical protein F5X71_01285 [Nocardia brasiliensis]|uniref:Uncharacterized protein n=1 Tax=Nocardia brasiliensis TaxID=37326 RepID=A0A6G9XJP3_NOCBR|nr:hypothetical protein [Nocardia brasiliensis]QIS01132.1 hypothetical protein F5X71_01285 [Nocardia brasiliensis]
MFQRRSEKLTAPLLPWAGEWGKERPRGKLVFAFVFSFILTVIFIPFSVDAAENDNSLRVSLGLAGTLVGLTSMIALIPILRVRRKTLPHDMDAAASVHDEPGLQIFYLSSWKNALYLWLAAGSAFLAIRGLAFFAQLTDRDFSTARSGLAIGGISIVLIALTMAAFLGYYLHSARNRRSFVAVTDHGVLQRSGHTKKSISWSNIGSVSANMVNNTHVVRLTPISGVQIDVATTSIFDRLQRGLLERSLDVPVWVLGMDPALFLHLVRFYWQHPDARHELGTDAVVDRMQRGDLLG